MREKFEQLRDLLNEILLLMDEQRPKLPEQAKFLYDTGDSAWVQQIDDGRTVSIRFFENGFVNSPEGPATWTLDDSVLVIRWPEPGAPNGAWVDTCKLAPDGKTYAGTNQDGVGIKGVLRALRRASVSDGTSGEFEILKEAVYSEQWPDATFSFQVANESLESDKEERAEGIANILLPPLNGKKFLDFGCGEGHVAKFAGRSAATSVGYDLSKSGVLPWGEKTEGFLLTTNFDVVAKEGPYDVILIYDVIDHASCDMADVLRQAGSLLSGDGTIFLRCHPWSSRHGAHLYKNLNKAFIHLIFSQKELGLLGLSPDHNQDLLYPTESYEKAIFAAGLRKSKEAEIDTQEVESFFHDNPLVRGRIMKTFGIKEWTENPPVFQMSLCFVDYVLKK